MRSAYYYQQLFTILLHVLQYRKIQQIGYLAFHYYNNKQHMKMENNDADAVLYREVSRLTLQFSSLQEYDASFSRGHFAAADWVLDLLHPHHCHLHLLHYHSQL